ncbi:hypothetical protein BGZ57DRAFT_778356, partial [Hyaloscypha finlandica]
MSTQAAGLVQLQADVGYTLARGLTADAITILGAFSADDVSPIAMLQVEAVGQQFPINGEVASHIPDLLSRFSSARLDRLGLAVGWRRGDAVSHMASSRGGQASALLSLCICEIFGSESIGQFIYTMSNQLLPKQTNASIMQLNKVGKLLAAKLCPVSLGSKLAELLTEIRLTYFERDLPIPELLGVPTRESFEQYLCALSRGLREESTIVRLRGHFCIGYFIMITMVMCPQDVLLSVEGRILY